ncbi:Porin Gram-negative type [Candidatus Accumulibacter aalborgensis]|uniref:Porin Gram-negative type n=1 Tax=Candidatus Accumulibacter aalborgensis TaxID=1860102 RepID=A0A1A8XT88_9PROT|nr:porin [Candidatus Accumulibacter aalborgensis]SBT07158.1 Porin Gram-negative type [Candidatus Accumulibacter aalborgensis]
MQKKLIALAVASLASGAAFAQTNVTMYGIADVGYIYSSGDAYRGPNGNISSGSNAFSGLQSGILSGSRLGFRGEEALGNGLKAVFTLEYSLNLDNNTGVGSGTGGLYARQQFVGLSSATLGTVALGRQYSPGYIATVNNDPLGGALVESQSYLSAQAKMTITPNSAARWNNAITYTSPNWSGFSAKGIYAFGETAAANGSYNDKLTDINANQMFGLGFNYANGPLNVDLVYQSRMNVVNADKSLVTGNYPPGTDNDINEYYVGASYDFKMVKIMGSYQKQNDKNWTNFDSNLWSLGAVIPVLSASNIHLAYAQLNMDQNSCGLLGTGNGNVCGLTGSTNSATLAWTTALSKRTTLYAGYVWNDNDKKSITPTTGGLGSSAGPVAGIGALGQTNNTLLAGIRHTF